MTVGAAGSLRRPKPRGVAAAVLAALLVFAVLAAHGLAPYLFKRATLQNEIATQVRATTGLTISVRHARFLLLPRPRVVTEDIQVFDPSGTVKLDAAALDGEVRLLPLVVGRVELSAVTLRGSHVVIDLGGQPMPADSTIGRVMRGQAGDRPGQRLGSVTLVDGTVRITDGARVHPALLSGVNAAIEWSDPDSPATLTGSLLFMGASVDLAAWIARPSELMRGESSAVVLRSHAAALDLLAKGTLSAGPASTFKGHLSGTAASLARVLAAVAPAGIVLPAAFADAALEGDARIVMDHARVATFDLHDLTIRADGNDYEGALAYRGGGGRPSVSATLAVGRLTLVPFLAHVPALLDADRRWSREALRLPGFGDIDLDLRVSATRLLLPPFTVDDAALAVISRDDRVEVALIEGRLCGGALKARVSFAPVNGDINLRGAGSIGEADAAVLTWDTFGRQVAAGSLSGSTNVESTGSSVAALMAHLAGWAKASASNGELSGLDLASGLRGADPMAVLAGGRTSFQRLDASARLKAGIAKIDEATMVGGDAVLSGGGTVNLGARTLDLRAVAAPSETVVGDGRASFEIDLSGPLDRLVVRPAAPRP